MAKTIEVLIDKEVFVATTAHAQERNQGILRTVNDRGILLSATDPKDGPIQVFLPWNAVLWVRALGEYEPPARPRVTAKPAGM